MQRAWMERGWPLAPGVWCFVPCLDGDPILLVNLSAETEQTMLGSNLQQHELQAHFHVLAAGHKGFRATE